MSFKNKNHENEKFFNEEKHKMLVWLPSPMGDAIMCVPALRALRRRFPQSTITCLGGKVVREILTPPPFDIEWLDLVPGNTFATARQLSMRRFTHAILSKNSFASALACFIARIPNRIGYARECRGKLLTEKLIPATDSKGKFLPVPMVDYYLTIAGWLGADTSDRTLELRVDPAAASELPNILPQVADKSKPLAVLVPGGAFGPSKCWPPEYFAKTADHLCEKYNANVVISVSPGESGIAAAISDAAKNKLINLAQQPLNLSQLKALIAAADIVISNDTGPRHIALAFERNVITLFGPNDPQWTQTDSRSEIQLVADVPCAPCQKPVCPKPPRACMESITVEQVCKAADEVFAKFERARRGSD